MKVGLNLLIFIIKRYWVTYYLNGFIVVDYYDDVNNTIGCNTNLFSTNTANAQEDYNDDKYGYYYYPPDYYKYECQKGPFEGDLVESVEFCFKKAHDRDDKQGDGEEDGPGPTGLFQSMQVITTNKLDLLLP